MTAFSVWECHDLTCVTCPTGGITGLTIYNYGTAVGGAAGDVTGLYFKIDCGDNVMAIQTMTYRGIWTVGTFTGPVWTWSGLLNWTVDSCRTPTNSPDGCNCLAQLTLYADINPCPTDGATTEFGIGYDPSTTIFRGGMTDNCGFFAPDTKTKDPTPQMIVYAYKKASVAEAAPGDTIDYSIFYGRPGTGNITDLTLTDSIPPYTHVVTGSWAPIPDAGWDPLPSTPMKLRWTFPGPLATAGGPTGKVFFQVTVDWGNGDSFEPGSGDVGAPEGEFLFNSAHLSWTGGGCTSGHMTNTPATSVRRFIFWELGDNDVLFAPRIGMPDDEIIYEAMLKNVSSSKTWWDVRIWDTVPPELDVWETGYGLEDPCIGWSMTPTGCAAAAAGKVFTSTTTVLTWKLDLVPGMTLAVRWKAKVRASVAPGSTAVNHASVMALGRMGVIGGTGTSVKPRVFIHEAQIVLRTTYVSYVGWAGDSANFYSIGNCAIPTAYYITFYPLNKAANFQLYRKWCCGGAGCEACGTFHSAGGVSPMINTNAGSCVGGPGSDWITGCKAERAPARYLPSQWTGAIPSMPFNFLHKLVSNSPVIWELQTCFGGDDDAHTYAGTTGLTYVGRIAYTWKEVTGTDYDGQYLQVGNTDMNQPTSLFFFTWNSLDMRWDFERTRELFSGSQYVWWKGGATHVRIVSSQTPIVVPKIAYTIGGNKDNDYGAIQPSIETGCLIAKGAPATYWVSGYNFEVGNVGATDAVFEMLRYNPIDPLGENPYNAATGPFPPVQLSGNAGKWNVAGGGTVPAGIGAAGNPLKVNPGGRLALVRLISGGPIQIVSGGNELYDGYAGGSSMHSSRDAAGNPGSQSGREFWLHLPVTDRECGASSIQTVNFFCPKNGIVMRAVSSGGLNEVYTTNAPDECVSYFYDAQEPYNYKFTVEPAPVEGNVTAQYLACQIAQKFFTAPFLAMGTYYDIIMPPTVFIGQSFWITVVVMDVGGGTKTDYNGTTSFTSTDPLGKIQSTPMDAYNFTWNGCGTDCGSKVFVNVIFSQVGLQSIVASDTIDGAITGIGVTNVVAADVKLTKERPLTVAASGDTVLFRICWSSYSSATAYTFVVTDAIPNGTAYVPEVASLALCGWNGPALPTVTMAYSTSTSSTPPTNFATLGAASSAASTTRWLRWTVRDIYVYSSGCLCFKVTVN